MAWKILADEDFAVWLLDQPERVQGEIAATIADARFRRHLEKMKDEEADGGPI